MLAAGDGARGAVRAVNGRGVRCMARKMIGMKGWVTRESGAHRGALDRLVNALVRRIYQ